LKPTRLISPPGTYFVTSSTWQRRQLFRADPWARLFLKILYGYRRQDKYQLHAFVLMPEHFHLIITPMPELTLERTLQLIKGGYSHAVRTQLGSSMEIWERGFTDHRIRDFRDFEQHKEYIHSNPEKRGLVAGSDEYRYCSAFPGFKLDGWPSAAEADLPAGA
jgi:putative transposase